MHENIREPSALEKVKARKALNHAVAEGKIVPQPCSLCGAAKAQGHHEDYAKPLEVEWLCAKCHSQLHNQKYPITKLCAVCQIEFTPHATKRARQVTCSRQCLRVRMHQRSRLSVDQMADIYRRYAAGGITQETLAREFGVDRTRIGQIAHGKPSKIHAINVQVALSVDVPAEAIC